MKNKDYRYSKLKHQLRELQHNGKKSVVWKLSGEQVNFVKKFYRVEPELYRIRTRYFSKEICEMYSILKHLNNEKKFKNHTYFVTKLNKKEIEILKEFKIAYTVMKHRIFLV